MEETLSLQDILKLIKKRFWLISSVTIIGIGIAIYLIFYFLTPMYQAQTQILVNQKVNYQEGLLGLNEVDLQLIHTYNSIITSSAILDKVIVDLDLKTTPEDLMENITVTNDNKSKVINIIIIDEKQEQAVKIANSVADVFKKEIPLIMNVDNINILTKAKYLEDAKPVKPNKLLLLAIGAGGGIALGIGLAVLLEIVDTRIKNPSDVEESLQVPLMGVVGIIQPPNTKKSATKVYRPRGNESVSVEK